MLIKKIIQYIEKWKILTLSIPERRNKIAQAKIYWMCLMKYGDNKCRFNDYRQYGKHLIINIWLHELVDDIENTTTPSSINVHATCHAEQFQVILSTALMKIQIQSKETYFTIITSELADKFQLPCRKINGMNTYHYISCKI